MLCLFFVTYIHLISSESWKNGPNHSLETTQVSEAAIILRFISQLQSARNGKSVLFILLGNELGVDYKCKVMEDAQIPAINEEKGTILLENALRLQGSHKLAQSVCYYYNTWHASKDRVWRKALIEADIGQY